MKRARNPPGDLPSIDWDAVAARLLLPHQDAEAHRLVRRVADERCPPRCRRGPTHAVVATLTSPAAIGEAWELVAPAEWIGDDTRSFVPLGGLPIRWLPGDLSTIPRRQEPTSLELVAALASDPWGVVEAEALARECASRLRPWRAPLELDWGAGGEAGVAWALLDPYWGSILSLVQTRVEYAARHAMRLYQWPQMETEGALYPGAAPSDAAWRSRVDQDFVLGRRAATREARSRSGLNRIPIGQTHLPQERAMQRALDQMVECRVWQEVARRGLVVPRSASAVHIPDALVGRRFDDLPNPYEPLVRLFELGYIVAFAEDGVVVLGASWDRKLISGPTWDSLGMTGSRRRRAPRNA